MKIKTMKKQVLKLKPKHRNHLWQDEEGDFWYWDSAIEDWALLRANDAGPGFFLCDEYNPSVAAYFTRVAANRIAF